MKLWNGDFNFYLIIISPGIFWQFYSPSIFLHFRRNHIDNIFLAFNRDTEWGVWNQLGMIESVAGDLRKMLVMEPGE